MVEVNTEKIHQLITMPIDPVPRNWQAMIEEQQDPFLFLKKAGEIYAYVDKADFQKGMTLNEFLEHAVSLKLVGALGGENSISLPFIFQTLGDPLTLIKEKDEYVGYIRREDLLVELLREGGHQSDWLKIMLSSIPMGVFIVNTERKIISGNEAGLRMIKAEAENVLFQKAGAVFDAKKIEQVFETGKAQLNQVHVTDELGVLFDYSPLTDMDGVSEGVMVIVQDLPKVEEMAMEMEYVKDLNADLNAILASLYDGILVVNSDGIILRYSDRILEGFLEKGQKELIDQLIFNLNEEIWSSVFRLVLKRKEQVSTVQETLTGKNYMALGNPIFDEDGELYRIVIAIRDITETTKLRDELHATKELTEEYKRELDSLKSKEEFDKRIIYRSLSMEKVMKQVEKLTEFDYVRIIV